MTVRKTAALGFSLALSLVFAFATAGAARAAGYAPLDCAKANTPTDRAICQNYALGQLEARTATLYQWTTALVAMGQRGDIQDAQRAFIKKREACDADQGCIRRAYDARIAQLEAVMKRIAGGGPY